MKHQFTASPKLYIGMDIHKKSWSIHLRTDISDHKSMTIPPNTAILERYVFENFPDHEVHLVYESGCCGFWVARYFLNLGWHVKVVNPADIPTMNKQTYQKTDSIDCRNLSKQLQADQLRGIYVPDEAQDFLKSLLRQRAVVSRQLRSTKNGIKSLLLYHGIVIPTEYDNNNWSKAFVEWIKAIVWKSATVRTAMESKLRTLEFLHREYLSLANELRAYCRKHYKTDYYLLKSVPGVGGYLASAILAEIGDLRRFNKASDFAGYVGIIPMMRNSGGTEKIIGVTPRCRALLRSYIIESARTALRLDPHMQSYYRKHAGKNSKGIIVKIAHKMLNRMLAVIKTGKPYQSNYDLNDGQNNKGTRKRTAKQPW
ncbi:MAG: IS110 family transposase [Bacteroidales bacterium]